MAIETDTRTQPRTPLTRDRVLAAAVGVADSGGLESLTMRRLAQELGVEAMSLYYHVVNKEAVLDGIVEVVMNEIIQAVGEIDLRDDDWHGAMRRQILTARQVLLRHPWAPDVIESRTTMNPAIVQYYESLLGILRRGGFSYDLVHHAMHALGSRSLGFTQELFEPDDVGGGDDEAALALLEQMADRVPYLVGMLSEITHDDPGSTLGWCDDQTEFEFGLDLILDGLERLRQADSPTRT